MKLDPRRQLYYNRYRYRATLTLQGLNRTYHCPTFVSFLKRLEQQLTTADDDNWSWTQTRKAEISSLDLNSLERWIAWRNHNFNKYRRPQTLMIRIEQATAGIFSNDLALLETLRQIDPGTPVSVVITEADPCIPQGVLTFAKQPKHRYRVYFKGGTTPASFRDNLQEFIDRYKSTPTEVFPCGALNRWLTSTTNVWRLKYCSSGFCIDYDLDSTYTLIALMFDSMVAKRFELLKRP